MRTKFLLISAAIFLFQPGARAQGVVAPPVSTFKPDSALPSVNVPEFVITGKTAVELPRAAKPTVSIDSSYFQSKMIRGIGVELPAYRDIGAQNIETTGSKRNLFARASIGHYTTTDYLVSGSDRLGGFNINADLSGNYTHGFAANTAARSFSIDAGISKDIDSQEMVRSSNSMAFGYTRTSYDMYGGPVPTQARSFQKVRFGVNSDMYLGELPLAFALDFNRFSLDDYWHNTESSLGLNASSQVQFSSGWLGFSGDFLFGNHMLENSLGGHANPLTVPADSAGFNRSIYDLHLRAVYGNSLLLGSFTYSLGLSYFQYRDDSSSTVAKIYPDIRANYRFNDMLSFFASFEGNVRRNGLQDIISSDRYVDGLLPLLNTQNNAVFSLGGRIDVAEGLEVIPEFGISSSKYYPVFYSDSTNMNKLAYSGKTSVTSFAIAAHYTMDNLSADLTLRYRKATTDSLSSVPNLAPFDAKLGVKYRITPQFTAGARFLLLSSRYSDLALANKLKPVSLLNVRLSYDFEIATLPLEAFAGGINILNQKYFIWQGYQEFPMTLYVGLSAGIL